MTHPASIRQGTRRTFKQGRRRENAWFCVEQNGYQVGECSATEVKSNRIKQEDFSLRKMRRTKILWTVMCSSASSQTEWGQGQTGKLSSIYPCMESVFVRRHANTAAENWPFSSKKQTDKSYCLCLENRAIPNSQPRILTPWWFAAVNTVSSVVFQGPQKKVMAINLLKFILRKELRRPGKRHARCALKSSGTISKECE